jgi:UDP-glucose 4-epimerase
MATILITGGTGYVGSHCALALSQAGHHVVVYDNMSNGRRPFAKFGPLVEGDLRDQTALTAAFKTHAVEAVLHCAALIEVGESVVNPAAFYSVNVAGSLSLLAAMAQAGVRRIAFSSTCATFGAPTYLPLDEAHPQAPLNPYGWTKLMVERALRDHAAAHGLKATALRYFNAAGAAFEDGLGERHEPESHAIPLALFALLGRRQGFKIFGDDYDTRDGTCVRDYIHVRDLADAHVRALERLLALSGPEGDFADFNLGCGEGVTVKELIAGTERVTGRRLNAAIAPRRPGDAPALIANSAKANAVLGWRAQRSLYEIIESAWRWHSEIEPSIFGA